MFIDEIDHDTAWNLWAKIQFNPIVSARLMFPTRPDSYVKVAKLVKAYLANKGTALGLPGKDRKDRRDVYIDIAARIYTEIPAWGRSINIDWIPNETPSKKLSGMASAGNMVALTVKKNRK